MKYLILEIIEIVLIITTSVLISVALTGDYWYDIKGADLSDIGFGKECYYIQVLYKGTTISLKNGIKGLT